jgi:hypothetical protein
MGLHMSVKLSGTVGFFEAGLRWLDETSHRLSIQAKSFKDKYSCRMK